MSIRLFHVKQLQARYFYLSLFTCIVSILVYFYICFVSCETLSLITMYNKSILIQFNKLHIFDYVQHGLFDVSRETICLL